MSIQADVDALIAHLDRTEREWFVTYAKPDDLRVYAMHSAAGNHEHAAWSIREATARWILACASRCVAARIVFWTPDRVALSSQERQG